MVKLSNLKRCSKSQNTSPTLSLSLCLQVEFCSQFNLVWNSYLLWEIENYQIHNWYLEKNRGSSFVRMYPSNKATTKKWVSTVNFPELPRVVLKIEVFRLHLISQFLGTNSSNHFQHYHPEINTESGKLGLVEPPPDCMPDYRRSRVAPNKPMKTNTKRNTVT